MHHQFLGVDAADDGVVPDLGAAREDDAARALLAADSACSEYSSSSTSPETSSHLQVPQLPAWQENGNGTPARSSDARMVSPASTGTGSVVAFQGDLHAATRGASDGINCLEAQTNAATKP